MTINSQAAIKALAITAVLVTGGVWFGLHDSHKVQAKTATVAGSDQALDAQVSDTMKLANAAHAQMEANLPPYYVCMQNLTAHEPPPPGGTNPDDAAKCGNLHGAPIYAIQAYEEKQHPLPLPNCWDNKGPWLRRQDPAAQKLWDDCMSIQALNHKRAQAAYEADQAKLASEQAEHKSPQADPNAIIPNL